MRLVIARGASTLFAAIAIAACGGSAARARESADAACGALYDAVCTQLEACSPIFPLLDGDHIACVTRRSAQCKKSFLGPGSKESAADLEACFRALAPTSCASLETFLFDNVALPDACGVLRGEGAPNTPCAAADQCASAICIEQGAYAEDDDPCGHCSAGHGVGDTCETLRDCAPGLTCAQQRCVAYGALGDACDDARPCDATLRCAAGACLCCAAGACATRVDEGGACDPSVPSCALDLSCNAVSKKCARPIAPAAGGGEGGASCGATTSGALDACARGFVCSADASGKSQCVALANEGEECLDRPCTLPWRCIRGSCALQDASTCH
jgi:hypothetical protein